MERNKCHVKIGHPVFAGATYALLRCVIGMDYWTQIFSYLRTSEVRSLACSSRRMNELVWKFYTFSFDNLHFACKHGKTIAVKKLLSSCPYLDPSTNESAAFHSACANGHSQVVELLLDDTRVSPSSNRYSGLTAACSNGHTDIVKMVLHDSRVDINVCYTDLLRVSIGNGHVTIVKLVLDDDRLEKDTFALDGAFCTACYRGYDEVVQLLLERKLVNPTCSVQYPICYAAELNYPKIVQLLLHDPRVDPCARYDTPLRYSCSRGHLDVVKVLLQDNRILSSFSQCSSACVAHACENGQFRVLQYLLDNPSTKSVIPSRDLEYGVIIACKERHVEVVKLLLHYNVDPSGQHNHAIRIACAHGDIEIVKLLLADPRVDPTVDDNAPLCR